VAVDLEALFNAIEDESAAAYGSDDGELSSDRAANIDRYLGKNVIPAPDGRSQVTDRSVYETIQWVQPSLSRIFANGDDVCDITPVGPEDEAGAKQEAQYLNHVILQKNNWVETFDTGSKDALMTKAGYLYAYKKVRRQIEVERYERQTPEALALILQDKPEIISSKEYPDEPEVDPATGQPAMDRMGQPIPPRMLYDVELRRVKEEPQFCIEALPPERCKVSKMHKTVQLRDCPYFEVYDWPTISELRQDGLEIPDDIDTGNDPAPPYDSPEDAARNLYEEQSVETRDPSMRRLYTRWVWIKRDSDEDGIAELQYCIVAGKKILHREEVNRIPVGVLCPDPLPHRHVGLCPADASRDIQDIKTSILRGALDNLQLTNNTRMFATPMVNLDDVLINRPGGVIRGKQGAVYGQDLMPIAVPPVFPQAMEAYGFMEQVNEGRTGVNRYFQGTDQNALNKTLGGIQQLSSMAAQRVEQVARMYAPGIAELFSILHELILKAGKFTDRVKLNGNWVTIDPTQWRRRTDFKMTVGYAAGNKDAMASRLLNLATLQGEALKGGLPIVTPKNAYETMIELTKSADLSNPERFWTDPATVQPQQPPPDPQLEAEKIKSQTTLTKTQMETEKDLRINAEKLMLEKYKVDTERETGLQVEQYRAHTGAELEDRKAMNMRALEGDRGNTKLALEQTKSEGAKAEQAKAEIGNLVNAVQQQLSEMGENQKQLADLLLQVGKLVSAPRVLKRDKAGRPIGSEVVQ
jgi:hypothetical protein